MTSRHTINEHRERMQRQAGEGFPAHLPQRRKSGSFLDMQAELEAHGTPRFDDTIQPGEQVKDWDGRRGAVVSVAMDRRSAKRSRHHSGVIV